MHVLARFGAVSGSKTSFWERFVSFYSRGSPAWEPHVPHRPEPDGKRRRELDPPDPDEPSATRRRLVLASPAKWPDYASLQWCQRHQPRIGTHELLYRAPGGDCRQAGELWPGCPELKDLVPPQAE